MTSDRIRSLSRASLNCDSAIVCMEMVLELIPDVSVCSDGGDWSVHQIIRRIENVRTIINGNLGWETTRLESEKK